jgi:uncharacterized membrane protein YdjX (TVP38/TMEM64 family)
MLARTPSVFINTMIGAGIMDDNPTQFIIAVTIYAVLIAVLYFNRKRLDTFIQHSKKRVVELPAPPKIDKEL